MPTSCISVRYRRILVPDWVLLPRYRTGPHQRFCSFRYRTDHMPDTPAFRHSCIDKSIPPCTSTLQTMDWDTSCTFLLLVVERDTPCMSIRLVVEIYTLCMSILLAVERDTPCMSIILVVERVHSACPFCWRWKGIHPACP
jgi:hypothetical protein